MVFERGLLLTSVKKFKYAAYINLNLVFNF